MWQLLRFKFCTFFPGIAIWFSIRSFYHSPFYYISLNAAHLFRWRSGVCWPGHCWCCSPCLCRGGGPLGHGRVKAWKWPISAAAQGHLKSPIKLSCGISATTAAWCKEMQRYIECLPLYMLKLKLKFFLIFIKKFNKKFRQCTPRNVFKKCVW